MTSLVHLLTAAAIFVHATLGCCAHEAHGARVAGGKPSDCCSAERANLECASLEHAGHANESHPLEAGLSTRVPCPVALQSGITFGYPSQQPVPHSCSHGNCKWSSPEAQNCVDVILLDSTGEISWSPTFALEFLMVHGSAPAVLTFLSPHAVPVRAHLAKCVLLV